MFKAMLGSLLALSLIACSGSGGSPAAPAPTAKVALHQGCHTLDTPSKKTVTYCVHASALEAAPPSVLYFFHGLDGSAEDIFQTRWMDFYQQVQNSVAGKVHLPHLVSISYGPAWFVTPNSAQNAEPTPRELIDYVFPEIEKTLTFEAGLKAPQRFIFGASMGGFNALNVAAATETQGQVVAALCPALANFDPFDQLQLNAYIQRNSALLDMTLVDQAVEIVQMAFGDSQKWSTGNPMYFLSNGSYDTAKVYISSGTSDQYGFFEGATAFVNQAQARGMKPTWAPVPGPHCSFDAPALVEFFTQNFGSL